MATVYRKTDKGQAEIETRAHRLVPRLRTALILVDGKRSGDDLAGLIANEPAQTLQTLLEQGFIEAFEVAPSRSAAPARPPVETPPAEAAPPAGDPKAFERRKREAVRFLTEQVGPMAEAIGIRIEKTSDWTQLLPALQLGQQILTNTRGAGVAGEFGRLFIDTPV
jgi:hypothetical protein